MEEGWAINIGGGFSHWTTNISSAGGLAVYDDVLVCLTVSYTRIATVWFHLAIKMFEEVISEASNKTTSL